MNLVSASAATHLECNLPMDLDLETGVIMQMTTRKAEQAHGYAAMRAHIKEIKQLVDRSTLRPVYWDSLSSQAKKRVIRSHTVFKCKFDPVTGEFQKIKARHVGDGNQQDRSQYDDISSPTVSAHAVYIGAGIAAAEVRIVKTADIPGAYLNGWLPSGIEVHVHLDEYSSAILVHLDESYRKYLRDDRTMVVKLDKALYGLIESAKIWFDTLSASLVALGFTRNPKEPCVLNKTVDGVQVTIFLYVDDLMFTSRSEALIDDVIAELKKSYGNIVVHEGKQLPYLGQEFDFRTPGQVTIRMRKYVEDLLTASGIEGTADTPASESLFSVRDAPKLDAQQAKDFHSQVASVLYMAKRARPDLLTAVSFLTRRTVSPDQDDLKKLHRLLKYINGTRELGLTIRPEGGMQVHAFVDASYAVHPDFKSHTGSAITIGGGATYAKSSAQKINTKSSTESELVGASDSSGHIIWVRDFLIGQGYAMGPAILYQDNMSAMALMEKGYSSSDKTRHINVRYFFIRDLVDRGELEIKYCPTDSMLADLLTKPLQGQQFAELRDRLLGITSTTLLMLA
jgi:Reverse transcriptase (RNA-dependent DNA polymerase)